MRIGEHEVSMPKTLATVKALMGQPKGLVSWRKYCSIAWNSPSGSTPYSTSLIESTLNGPNSCRLGHNDIGSTKAISDQVTS